MSAEEKYLVPQTSSPPSPAGDSLEKYLAPQQATHPLSRGVLLPASPAPDYEKYLVPQQAAAPTPQPVSDAGNYEKYLKPAPLPLATSKAVEDVEFSNEDAARGSRPYVPVTLPVSDEDTRMVGPSSWGRRAIFKVAQDKGIPEDFTREWMDHQQVNGRLKTYDLQSRSPFGDTNELLKATGYDPNTKSLTLHVEAGMLDQLQRDYEESKGYFQKIKETYDDPKTQPGAVAYQIAAPVASGVAHGLDLVTRPLQAAVVGGSGLDRAVDPVVGMSEMYANGRPSNPLEVLKGIPGAMAEKFMTGETRPGYETPLTGVTENLAGPAMDRFNPNLRPLVHTATEIFGDPLLYVGGEAAAGLGRLGSLTKAGRLASVLDRDEEILSKVANVYESQTGVRPILTRYKGGYEVRLPGVDGGADWVRMYPPGSVASSEVMAKHSALVDVVKAFDAHDAGAIESAYDAALKAGATDAEIRAAMLGNVTPTAPAAAGSLPRRPGGLALDIYRAPSAIRASGDISAPGHAIILSANHPIYTVKTVIPEMVKAFLSDEHFETAAKALADSPMQPLREQGGLFMSSVNRAGFNPHEEYFRSSLADMFPLVKRSDRAFSLGLDLLRTHAYDGAVAANPDISVETMKGIAKSVNYFSGRAGYGRLEGSKVIKALEVPFWSPRLTLSRLQALGLPATAGTAEARHFAAKYLVKFVASGLSIAGLAKMSGAEVTFDPRTSKGLTIGVGNTYVNMFGGFSPLARTITQSLISHQVVDEGTGEKRDAKESRWMPLVRYGRERLAPIPGVTIDLLTGRMVTGEKATKLGAVKGLTLYLAADDIQEAVRHSSKTGAAISPLSMLGISVNTRTPRTPEPATPLQIKYVRGLTQEFGEKVDLGSLTKSQASAIINRLKARQTQEKGKKR
jgi:hypothetical protein